MKNYFFKGSAVLMVLAVFSMLAINSCTDDPEPEPIPVEDGLYIMGGGTALDSLAGDGLMTKAKNEVLQEVRSTLYEMYIAVEAGTEGFNLVNVVGGVEEMWGPGPDFAEVAAEDLDAEEPQAGLWKGSYEISETPFTVPEDGLYHVMLDTELGVMAIAKVEWGMIGAATPGGWGSSTALTEGSFDLESVSFDATDVVMVAGDFKFRYSNGWKIILDADYDNGGDNNPGVKVNTNFGGSLSALDAGGDNIANAENGLFAVSMTWSLEDGTSATVTKTGEYTPPAYPEAVYLVGDATAYGWDTPGTKEDAVFHKADGGSPTEGLFWKIAYIETGKGFKISEADWGTINLGHGDVDEYDANGVVVSDNGGNMSIAESGMYMIVLDLRNDTKKVSVIAPEVYGIGDAFGGWDEDAAANKFTVDNTAKTITSPALSADGNVRSYVHHEWIPDWWNAEFVPNAGVIEYRNNSGSDPSAIAGTTGQVITYMFDDNTCTLE